MIKLHNNFFYDDRNAFQEQSEIRVALACKSFGYKRQYVRVKDRYIVNDVVLDLISRLESDHPNHNKPFNSQNQTENSW